MAWLQRAQTSLGWALEAEAPASVGSHRPLWIWDGQNGYIWNFPKADGYSIGIGTFQGGEGQDFKSILSEYASCFGVDVRTSKQYGHPCLWDGNQSCIPKCDFGWRNRLCSWPYGGIRPSIFSGLKSVAIDQAIAGDLDALEKYTQVISEEWELIWRGQRLAGCFIAFLELATKWVSSAPLPLRAWVRSCVEMSYGDVAGRALKRLSSSRYTGYGWLRRGQNLATLRERFSSSCSLLGLYIYCYSSVKI